MDNDREWRDMRSHYRKAMGAKLEKLEAARLQLADPAAGAMESIRDLAHDLAGSAGTYGFPELGFAAQALEASDEVEFEGRLAFLTGKLARIHAETDAVETKAPEEVLRSLTALTGRPGRVEPAKPRILLAEDDVLVANIVIRKLEGEGYAVIHVVDGEAAWRKASHGTYAMFILDVNMPVRNGFALLQDIRRLDACRNVPILMLTSKNQPSDVKRGISLGASDYMVKPFLPYNLVKRVRKWVGPAGAPGLAAGNPEARRNGP